MSDDKKPNIAEHLLNVLTHPPGTEEQVLRSQMAILHEFFAQNPAKDVATAVHPGLKARRIARYLEHLADVFERGSLEGTDEGLRRASLAAREIQKHITDMGQPHERLAHVIDGLIRQNPDGDDEAILLDVFLAVMHSHPEVGLFLRADRVRAAVQAWRVDGRKSRASRRADGTHEKRWEALAAALEGTGAHVAPNTIKQAFFGRRKKAPKRSR
jgi:hypothetical protein